MDGRKRVIICNKKEAFCAMMELDMLPNCAKVISQMKFARGLNATEYAFFWLINAHDGAPYGV
jgi:hypothetical protein